MNANCISSGLGINLFTSDPDVHIGDTLFYSINVFNGIPGSGRIVCDATGIVAIIVTPDAKTNAITLRRTTLHQGESDFYPDVVSYVVRAQDIQPDGTLREIGVIHRNDTDNGFATGTAIAFLKSFQWLFSEKSRQTIDLCAWDLLRDRKAMLAAGRSMGWVRLSMLGGTLRCIVPIVWDAFLDILQSIAKAAKLYYEIIGKK